jgi:hypothetical protein
VEPNRPPLKEKLVKQLRKRLTFANVMSMIAVFIALGAGESGLSFNPVGFYKDHEGIVHLQGIAKVGKGGTVDSIFTLPAGFRPAPGKLILGGKVIGEEEVSVLDGITFRAES